MSTSEILLCPKCRHPLNEDARSWFCHFPFCGFSIPKLIRQRIISREIVGQLCSAGITGMIQGFQKRGSNDTFPALLRLGVDFKVHIELGRKTDIPCPLCGANILKTDKGFLCSSAACSLVVRSEFYGKHLTDVQMQNIVITGSSGIVNGFVSRKNGSTFSAEIVCEVTPVGGRLRFKFPDRLVETKV